MGRRRRSRKRGGESRRSFLFRAGMGGAALFGVVAASNATGAFTSIGGSRSSSVKVASDSQGLIGIIKTGPAVQNTRKPILRLTNNSSVTVTITVTLQDCSDGTLFDNAGESGCSVSFVLASGNFQFLDIMATTAGTITLNISASGSGLTFDTTATVESRPPSTPPEDNDDDEDDDDEKDEKEEEDKDDDEEDEKEEEDEDDDDEEDEKEEEDEENEDNDDD